MLGISEFPTAVGMADMISPVGVLIGMGLGMKYPKGPHTNSIRGRRDLIESYQHPIDLIIWYTRRKRLN